MMKAMGSCSLVIACSPQYHTCPFLFYSDQGKLVKNAENSYTDRLEIPSPGLTDFTRTLIMCICRGVSVFLLCDQTGALNVKVFSNPVKLCTEMQIPDWAGIGSVRRTCV